MRLHRITFAPIYFLFASLVFITSIDVSSNELHEAVYTESSPSWAKHNAVDFSVPIPVDEISDGIFYRLIDNQLKVEVDGRREAYSRYIKGVANNKGVENVSQINLDFDPSYQTLHLHAVYIVRDGQRIDKLATSSMSVVNREKDLSSLIYNGIMTLNVIVDDVRVGDSLEYEFTRKGANPVYKGLFSYSRSINWSVPVQRQFVRVLWGKSNELYSTIINSNAPITKSIWQGYKEYQLKFNFEKTLKQPSQTPSWYDSYATAFFSESEEWGDVVDWAEPMYQFDSSNDLVNNIAMSIKQQHASPSRQIVAALKYVQDEIRYFGIEMGQNSHLPTPPEETLTLKYGDCKDKAALFLALLKQLEIEAYPALVHTEDTKLLASLPPAVGRFNHVITTLFFDNKQWWLDPTMSNQFGGLTELHQPNFGYALVLKPGQNELTKMDNIDLHSKIAITERFTVAKGDDAEAKLSVNTLYYGDEANAILNRFERDGKLTMAEDYEIYYQGFFASLYANAELSVVNDERTGIVSIDENYTIPKFWRQGEDSSIDFYPNEIRNAVKKVEEINRNTPLSLTYPDKISHTFVIEFSEGGWDFDDEWTKDDNNYFTFSENVEFADNVLTLHYEYQAKTDHVPVAEIDQYIEARERLGDVAFFGIQKYTEEHPESSFIEDNDTADLAPSTKDSDVHKSSPEPNSSVLLESKPAKNETLERNFSRLQILLICLISLLVIGLALWRIEAARRPTTEPVEYVPQGISKFLLLSWVTCGLYCQYWMYRNWQFIKVKHDPQIAPIVRALFSVIWLYPLYQHLISDSMERFGKNRLVSRTLAITLAALYIVLNVIPFLIISSAEFAIYLVLPLVCLPLVVYVNKLNKSNSLSFAYNSEWRVSNSVTVVLFAPLWFFWVGAVSQYLPSERVVTQDELSYSDLKFLYRKSVFPPSETLTHFYSASVLDIKEDGNGLTNYRVFSYWLEKGELVVHSAPYTEIRQIDVVDANSRLEETIVTITLHNGRSFVVFVPNIGGDDKLFVESLNRHWQQNRILE